MDEAPAIPSESPAPVPTPIEETEPGAARRFRAAELDRHIGDRLRFLRRLSSLSQRHVADEIGLSFQQLQKYENGANRVSAALLAEFSGLLRVPMDWFIGPFNACLERDMHAPAGTNAPMPTYALLLDHLYRALRDHSETECDITLDAVCSAAGVGSGPRETRLFRLWRAMRDGTSGPNGAILEATRALIDIPRADQVLAEVPPLEPALVTLFPSGTVPEDRGHPAASSILLVDDDPDVLSTLSASLASAGFRMHTASSGHEALTLLASGFRVDIMITDYSMPGMDGVELLAQATPLRPGLRGIVITGFADAGRLRDLPIDVEVLSKPFRRMELIGRVRLLLDGPAPTHRRLKLVT